MDSDSTSVMSSGDGERVPIVLSLLLGGNQSLKLGLDGGLGDD